MSDAQLKVQQLTVGPLEENCWLLADPTSGQAVLVDPGDEPARLLDAVAKSGCALVGIWLTHAHFDHVGGVAGVVRETPVPICPIRRTSRSMSAPPTMRHGGG